MKTLALKITVAALVTSAGCLAAAEYCDIFVRGRFSWQIHSLGLSALIVLVPYFLIMLSDTCGWMMSFGKRTSKMSAGKLLLIRIASETLQVSLPGGALYAEFVRPHLLKKHFGLGYAESISANIITKVNILLAQGMFVVLGVGVLALQSAEGFLSTKSFSRDFAYVTAGLLLILPFLGGYFLYSKNLLLHVIHLLEKSNVSIVKNLLQKTRKPLLEINCTISAFSRNKTSRLFMTIVFFFFSWMLMAIESLVILYVMGIEASVSQVILVESLSSLVRIVFFFIPGAIGPQDVSVVALFSLAGFPDPAANSLMYVLMKRSKELIWIVAGYSFLVLLGVRPCEMISRSIEKSPLSP